MTPFATHPRRFNVTGTCYPDRHYMADTSGKIAQIIKMIERGDYFTINRARQYGKTTTISILDKKLPTLGYQVIRTSFEGTSDSNFESESNFCQGFLFLMRNFFDARKLEGGDVWQDPSVTTFDLLSKFLSRVCEGKRIVLMIDETDKSSNNLIFLRFVGMLRDKYLLRGEQGATFHSVILAGVYDIKNLKLKMIQAGTHQLQDGEKRINSPWNIAANFNVDMSLSVTEIASMLNEYENDYHTGMDIQAVAEEIRFYTNGYPYLCSRICQIIDEDEDVDRDWSVSGVQKAVKCILNEKNLLFDDIAKNINSNKDLYDMIFSIVALGTKLSYNSLNLTMDLGLVFGFLIKKENNVMIGNRIFEILFYEFFIQQTRMQKMKIRDEVEEDFIDGKRFNMERTIRKFMEHYYEMYRDSAKEFLESECRMLFLTYMRPLINGAGFYHIESETRNAKRMDIIVDYEAEQFIVELKLWYGDVSLQKAFSQLAGYLDSKKSDVGYLLTFDFRKDENVGAGSAEWIEFEGKRIFNCIVGR